MAPPRVADPCSAGLFRCGDNSCVAENRKCDGRNDCENADDETLPECGHSACRPLVVQFGHYGFMRDASCMASLLRTYSGQRALRIMGLQCVPVQVNARCVDTRVLTTHDACDLHLCSVVPGLHVRDGARLELALPLHAAGRRRRGRRRPLQLDDAPWVNAVGRHRPGLGPHPAEPDRYVTSEVQGPPPSIGEQGSRGRGGSRQGAGLVQRHLRASSQ